MEIGPVRHKLGFWRRFFMVVGILTTVFVLLLAAVIAYVVIAKPFGVGFVVPWGASEVPYDHPLLTPQQEQTLQSIGVDVRSIPTEVTKAQEECLIAAFGEARIREIASGSAPSVGEVLKANACFK